jgi:hypothetical protein
MAILGSVNSNIKVSADGLTQIIFKKIDFQVLVPSLTSVLPFTNPKAKLAILGKFTGNSL